LLRRWFDALRSLRVQSPWTIRTVHKSSRQYSVWSREALLCG
jgi:hypothetical protein